MMDTAPLPSNCPNPGPTPPLHIGPVPVVMSSCCQDHTERRALPFPCAQLTDEALHTHPALAPKLNWLQHMQLSPLLPTPNLPQPRLLLSTPSRDWLQSIAAKHQTQQQCLAYLTALAATNRDTVETRHARGILALYHAPRNLLSEKAHQHLQQRLPPTRSDLRLAVAYCYPIRLKVASACVNWLVLLTAANDDPSSLAKIEATYLPMHSNAILTILWQGLQRRPAYQHLFLKNYLLYLLSTRSTLTLEAPRPLPNGLPECLYNAIVGDAALWKQAPACYRALFAQCLHYLPLPLPQCEQIAQIGLQCCQTVNRQPEGAHPLQSYFEGWLDILSEPPGPLVPPAKSTPTQRYHYNLGLLSALCHAPTNHKTLAIFGTACQQLLDLTHSHPALEALLQRQLASPEIITLGTYCQQHHLVANNPMPGSAVMTRYQHVLSQPQVRAEVKAVAAYQLARLLQMGIAAGHPLVPGARDFYQALRYLQLCYNTSPVKWPVILNIARMIHRQQLWIEDPHKTLTALLTSVSPHPTLFNELACFLLQKAPAPLGATQVRAAQQIFEFGQRLGSMAAQQNLAALNAYCQQARSPQQAAPMVAPPPP